MQRTILLIIALAMLVPTAAAQAHESDSRARSCARLEQRIGSLDWNQALANIGHRRHRRRHGRRPLESRFADRCVALNQLQVLGTHNSYHVQPPPVLINIYLSFDDRAFQWEYTHLPLAEQFQDQGIRQIELDVYADPAGGLYAEPFGLKILLGDLNVRIPELDAPGLKVIHVPELDWNSTCLHLVECLGQVKIWSDAHPGHVPLMVLVEVKEEAPPDPLGFGFAVPIPFGPAELDTLDAEIRSIFPEDQLLTPDDVRDGFDTLEEAVLTQGWPVLREARGRVLFALDNGGATRLDYLEGHPSLEGRVLFTNSIPGSPDAAFVKLNDPLASAQEIADLVRSGYIIRTRADADTLEARDNDTLRRDTALASGAQFVSTDYPVPDPDFGTGYRVELPGGGPVRCNPVNAPPGCRDQFLER